MKRCDEHEYERLLRRELQREALEDIPEFSEALHARVLAAIGGRPIAVAMRKRRRPTVASAFAATAAVAVAAGLLMIWGHRPDGVQPPATVASHNTAPTHSRDNQVKQPEASVTASQTPRDDDLDAAADEVADSAAGVGDWMQTTADENQWAGLDRDAQSALAAVAGPLPFDVTLSLASNEAGP